MWYKDKWHYKKIWGIFWEENSSRHVWRRTHDCKCRPTQQTQNICVTFEQCWTNVEDVGPTLNKCYTNVLCLLGIYDTKYVQCTITTSSIDYVSRKGTLGQHYPNQDPLSFNHKYNRVYYFFVTLFKNATVWPSDLKRYIGHVHKVRCTEMSTVSRTQHPSFP